MRWRRTGRSADLEDRRRQTGGRISRRGAGIGLGGMLILLVLSFLFKENFFALMDPSMMSGSGGPMAGPALSRRPLRPRR